MLKVQKDSSESTGVAVRDPGQELARKKRSALAIVTRVTGVTFVLAGLPKFFAFHWELQNFTHFGLPEPALWVVAAGVIEIAGGVLLLARRWTLGACALLGVTMAVAISVSGIRRGDVIPSLTLAPALLVACGYIAFASARRAVEHPKQS